MVLILSYNYVNYKLSMGRFLALILIVIVLCICMVIYPWTQANKLTNRAKNNPIQQTIILNGETIGAQNITYYKFDDESSVFSGVAINSWIFALIMMALFTRLAWIEPQPYSSCERWINISGSFLFLMSFLFTYAYVDQTSQSRIIDTYYPWQPDFTSQYSPMCESPNVPIFTYDENSIVSGCHNVQFTDHIYNHYCCGKATVVVDGWSKNETMTKLNDMIKNSFLIMLGCYIFTMVCFFVPIEKIKKLTKRADSHTQLQESSKV
jgi:hypothetical protein